MRHFPFGCLCFLGLLATALPGSADETVPIPWLGENLVTNAGFEEAGGAGTPPGWELAASPGSGIVAEADAGTVLEGRHSFRIASPGKEKEWARLLSDAIPVEGGASYLFSVGFRQTGFSPEAAMGEEAYAGVSSFPRLHWLGANREALGHSAIVSRFPYGPTRWDFRDALETAPAGARFARIEIALNNSGRARTGRPVPATLWIDALQLRRYIRPPTPAWATGEGLRVVEGGASFGEMQNYFLAEEKRFRGAGGKWAAIVPDPAAERGAAIEAPADTGKGLMLHSPYFTAPPPGLYRLRARVRLPQSAPSERLGYVDVNTERSGMRLFLPFRSSSETSADGYTVVEGDFILRDAGWYSLRVYTEGKASWRIDWLKVLPLHYLDDRRLLAVYPGSEGELPEDLAPPPFELVLGGPVKPMRALVVAGMGFDRYRISETIDVLHRDARSSAVWATMHGGSQILKGFPEDPADLFEYTLLFLCNVDMRAMGIKYKNAVREFVRRGGALVVLAGHRAFGRGGWEGSLIEETLPVTSVVEPAGGKLHIAPHGLTLELDPGLPGYAGLDLSHPPTVFYLNRVRLNPGAKVWARAGDAPFLVGGEYGRGRTLCILGLPCGTPDQGQTPFWQWDQWIPLFREACWWALRNPAMLPCPDNDEGA